ncbi:quinon protein alcohol dehydrogenase-like superfamily [Diplogelasinospora grovesii]|uniref:Quinon protein alcohol dehydrogenase-like superfamily n=1 Tax=Diplogelasinospora grovesii TaxID=303347 RepID=A0AAN6NEN8_9PEZI|nr:quinon protein alcohol dehydrogenase-like superfamily [Diplogelasinospora grovesii]
MDIHRCRFVPCPASAINAVAFTHSSLPAKKSLQKNVQVRLAIGRANGDIEIWNPLNGAWHQEVVIQGGADRSIDGLVWVTDPDEEVGEGNIIHGRSRLFSIGYTTTVTEWDLEKAKAKKHASGQHGDIWCLAIQPPSKGKDTSRKLVAGTVDGNLVIYSIEDDDLKFQRTLIRTPSKKVKMVSICFQSRNIVIVGCSNSTICAYDIRSGTLLRTMTLGSDLSGSTAKNIIVWSVKCLPDGDIVSGDSTGQVCIWDGRTYTQAQRIQSHTQDVLCLAVSADGSKIVSGGMDRRTALYEPMAGHNGRWSKVFHRRYHSHDVKAMASFEGKGMSVVVSGGPDAAPVAMPLRGAGREYHRSLPHLPQSTSLQSASKARLMCSWWGNEIRIWHLPRPASELMDGGADGGAALHKNRKLIAQILVKGESNISSAAISEDGTLLVASTASDIKAFQLDFTDASTGQPKITKVNVPSSVNGATKVEISQDKQWVCWVEEGSRVMAAKVTTTFGGAGITTCSISQSRKLHRVRRQIPKYLRLGGLGAYDRSVTQVAFSPDSKMLGAADLAGYIDTWVLRSGSERQNGTADDDDDDAASLSDSDSDSESEDAEGAEGELRWVRNPKAALIPKLPAAPVVLSFAKQPLAPEEEADGDYSLLAITAMKHVFVFNPLQGTLSDWSRRNPYGKIPEQFLITRDLVKGVVWQGPRAWIYGHAFLFMLDLSQDFDEKKTKTKALVKSGATAGTKRKRGNDGGAGGKMDKHALAPQNVKVEIGGGEWVDVEMGDVEDDAKSVGGAASTTEFEDDDDDDEDESGGELQRLRNGETNQGGVVVNGGELVGGEAVKGEEGKKKGKKTRPAKWWHTYHYRSILGIVPVDIQTPKEGGEESKGLQPLEVAIVERPTWDVDLPPRYFGDGEWER